MADLLRFQVLHVSSKDIRVLRSLVGLAGTKTNLRCTVSEDDEGDALLIDVDSPDGAALWPEVSQQALPAVALTKRRDFPARFILHKPIRSQHLIRLLSELANAADEVPDPDQWPVMVFGEGEAELPLGEHLRRHTWDQPVMLGGDYLSELIIDSGAGAWFSSASDRELARLLRRSFSAGEAQPLSSAALVEHTNGLEQQSLTNLKWRAGLALSSGALHPDLAGEVRLMLPQVPLQALSDTAYSRQARTLIRKPMTARELLEAASAERNDVAEFLNACHACGFLLLDSSSGSKVASR